MLIRVEPETDCVPLHDALGKQMVQHLGKNIEDARSAPGSAFGKETIRVLQEAHRRASMNISYLSGRLDQANRNGERHVIVIQDDDGDEDDDEADGGAVGSQGGRQAEVMSKGKGLSVRKSIPVGSLTTCGDILRLSILTLVSPV